MRRPGVLSAAARLVGLSSITWHVALLLVAVYALAALGITSNEQYYPGVFEVRTMALPGPGAPPTQGLGAPPCGPGGPAHLYFLYAASSTWLVTGLFIVVAAYLAEGEAARTKLEYLVALLGRRVALRAYAVYSLTESLIIVLPLFIGVGVLAYLYGGVPAPRALAMVLYLVLVTSVASSLYWVVLALMGSRRYFVAAVLAYLSMLVLETFKSRLTSFFDPVAALSLALSSTSPHVLSYPLATYAIILGLVIAMGEKL